jgi:Na+-transporting methylmalonyl-CoA/oxaloacetate decarboxylase gamma subunit
MKFLDKIRNKSLEQRKMIALMVSGTVTFFIFAIWLITLIYGFSDFDSNDMQKENTASPVNIVTDQIKGLFSGKETYKAE